MSDTNPHSAAATMVSLRDMESGVSGDAIGAGCVPAKIFTPAGVLSCSRWLSTATPPDHDLRKNRTPAGVPASSSDAIHAHQPALSPDLRDQTPGIPHFEGMARRIWFWTFAHRNLLSDVVWRGVGIKR